MVNVKLAFVIKDEEETFTERRQEIIREPIAVRELEGKAIHAAPSLADETIINLFPVNKQFIPKVWYFGLNIPRMIGDASKVECMEVPFH